MTDQSHASDMQQPPSIEPEGTIASSADSETRRELETEGNPQGQAVFTKGDNAPTFDEVGLPYTVEDMKALETGPTLGSDMPSGSGATPLSIDRDAFIHDVMRSGHFVSPAEALTWCRAVFDALRRRALEADHTIMTELAPVVRAGEAPEVQVEEMMWGGDYAQRMLMLLKALDQPTKSEFYRDVAQQVNETADDPWVENAVYSFFGALKQRVSSDESLDNLGELHEVWQRADELLA